MALMYDMETVNRAMTEAAKLYDPKHKSAKRVKKVLEIFAGMKPTPQGRWLLDHYNGWDNKTRWVCSNCLQTVYIWGRKRLPFREDCPHCHAIMDRRAEE